MPRGNPNIGKYSHISGINVTTTEEDNANYINLLKEAFVVDKPDLSNQKEVDNAIQLYLDRCARHNIRPGNMGLYNALGITRQDVNDYLKGKRKAPSSTFIDTLKKVKASMAEYREILGSQGKLSPPTLIFWQKNHDGFEDVQKVELDANAAPQAEKTPEEVARMIESDIPIDVDAEEV